MKSIISFDLDMTLLSHRDYKIPDSTMAALKRLREHFYIVLATGRDMDSHFSREFRDLLQPDGIVHLNGTKVTARQQLIYDHSMDKQLLKELLNYAEHQGYGIGVTIGNDDFYTHPEQVEAHDIARFGESGRNFKDVWSLLDKNVRTMAYVGDPEGIKAMKKQFPQVKFLMFAGGTGADIVEQGMSKSHGLAKLCEHFGTTMKETYAFGDSMNDVEMIRDAGIGIAMGNAVEPVKAVADYVTTAIDQDGIWNACVHFGLIDEGNTREDRNDK